MKANKRAQEIIKVLNDEDEATKGDTKKKALYFMRLIEGITDHYPPDNMTKVYYADVKKKVQDLDK